MIVFTSDNIANPGPQSSDNIAERLFAILEACAAVVLGSRFCAAIN
jgi:hypothetical protein